MKEKLEELRKDRFLELSTWAGFSPTPGITGVIITKDNKIYHYHQYNRVPNHFKEIPLEDISDRGNLSQEKYEELVSFMEKNIFGKDQKAEMIFDAKFTIEGKIKNQEFKVVNQMELYQKLIKIIGG